MSIIKKVYPFVVSVGALKIISKLNLTYDEVLSISREFNVGGCHTFLLRSDIINSMNMNPEKLKVKGKKVDNPVSSKPLNWSKKKYGNAKYVKFYVDKL